MKRMIAILLGATLAMPVFAEEVNKSVDAAANGHVHVSNISGSVKIQGWSRNQVEVTGEIGRNVEELIVVRDGDKVTVKVKTPKRGGRGIESDLHIQVPQGSSIDVGTISADIDVTDVHGDQSLNAVSGDIDTEVNGGDISAAVVSGDIEVNGQNKDAETHATAVSGNVTLFRISGTVEVETVTGDLVLDEGSFDRASINSVNGQVLFQSELRDGGKMGVETVNGDVRIEFADDVSGRFEIDTFNGSIDNCFGPKPERTSKYTPGWEVSFQEGDGDARIRISTLNGDVTMCK